MSRLESNELLNKSWDKTKAQNFFNSVIIKSACADKILIEIVVIWKATNKKIRAWKPAKKEKEKELTVSFDFDRLTGL